MTSFVDSFGGIVTGNPDGTWTRSGMTVGPCAQNAALVAFNAVAPSGWNPRTAVVATIAPGDFIDRFSLAEKQAVLTAAQTDWHISLWMSKEVAASVIDVTNPEVVNGISILVAAGLVSPTRGAIILDLTQPSP